MTGRIIKGIGGFYYIEDKGRIISGTARGILKRGGEILYVGDVVDYEMVDEDEFVITSLVERRNHLSRPPVSNIDMLVITFAAEHPKPDLITVDKLCVGALYNDIDVAICINKYDLAEEEVSEKYSDIYGDIYPTAVISAKTGGGISNLLDIIRGKRVAFAGASGVGKSTIVNILTGTEQAKTGEINDKISRGKHTTRHVQIFKLMDGTEIFDTPGFTSIDTPNIDHAKIGRYMPEFLSLSDSCRYSDCIHINEPGCSVKSALDSGKISQSRYTSYISMVDEAKKCQR